MKAARSNFFSSIRDSLAKRLLIDASACLVLLLGSASQIHAQSVADIFGVAGFETKLQAIASVGLAHKSQLGDLFPPGAVIRWGDNSQDEPGLLICTGTSDTDPCLVYGSHWYASPGTYPILIFYNGSAFCRFVSFFDFTCGPGDQHVLQTNAIISAPPTGDNLGTNVILSIGDSIASGEGSPDAPNSPVNYACAASTNTCPGFGYWDDPFSNDLFAYPPDERAVWPSESTPCHRSGWAGPVLAAQMIQSTNPGVTFIHYACSGAKIQQSDTPDNTVQDAINQLRVARGRLPRIDTLLISAGVNSLSGSFGSGFGDLVHYCLLHSLLGIVIPGDSCADPSNPVGQEVANSLTNLTKPGGSYDRLAQVINCIDPDTGAPEPSCSNPQMQIPKMVLITEYMDPTHDQSGNYPSHPTAFTSTCAAPAFQNLSSSEWQFFHDSIVHPLNQAVDSFSVNANRVKLSAQVFAVTGIEQAFSTHGICAGNERWVYDIADSENLLGQSTPGGNNLLLPPKGPWIRGTFHPISASRVGNLGLDGTNCCGQEVYRDAIYNAIVNYSPPVTTASATVGVGGAPYTFTTPPAPAFPEVVVTLTASNAIKESGVSATYYGVDANCAQVGISNNCALYAAPFTISSPGQHTVTFFSSNARGYFEAPQSLQVLIGTNQSLTVTANNVTRQYGAADPSFTVSYSGFVNGDTQNTPGVLTGALTCTSTDTPTSNVGTYSINCSGLSSPNYNITYVPGTVTVTQAPLTTTANNTTLQYGQAIPAFTGTIAGLQNGDNITASYSTSATAGSPVGLYAITPTLVDPTGKLGNYAVTVNSGILTVTAAPLTVTVSNASRQYGQANPAFTGTIAGLQNGDNITANYATIATPASSVGNYAITPTLVDPGGKLVNYAVTLNNGTLAVTAAPLTITANPASRQYGAADPAFTVSYGGFVNGDSSAVLTGTLMCTAGDTVASPVGTYALNCSGPSSPNYSIAFVPGVLTITAVPLTVTSNNTSRVYGAANPAFTGTIAGLQNGDNITANYATSATPASPVGNYAITPTLVDPGGKLVNYAVTLNNGAVAVTAAPLTITTNNATRGYGQPNPPFTGTIAGLQNADNITANYATSATPPSPVGNYAITPTLVDPGGKLGDYAVTLNNGTLAVTAAPLTITANSATRGYGQPNPPFGPSYSGFVNGENASALAGTLTCTTSATPSSPVAGSPYAINCSGLTSLNYAITYAAGALTVTAAPLTITANGATKILNAPLPALGASYSGFVNGEGPSALTGSLSCTTTATATSPVGSYPITCSGLTAANYAITLAAGTLKVMYAPAGVCGHVILPPIDPAGTTVGNQGRTVPAMFRVCDANGVSTGTPGVVTSFLLAQIISGTATTNVENIVDTNNPDTAFRWDGTEWIFNITTQNLAAGSTYVYTIMLNDGSTIVFQFGLR